MDVILIVMLIHFTSLNYTRLEIKWPKGWWENPWRLFCYYMHRISEYI